MKCRYLAKCGGGATIVFSFGTLYLGGPLAAGQPEALNSTGERTVHQQPQLCSKNSIMYFSMWTLQKQTAKPAQVHSAPPRRQCKHERRAADFKSCCYCKSRLYYMLYDTGKKVKATWAFCSLTMLNLHTDFVPRTVIIRRLILRSTMERLWDSRRLNLVSNCRWRCSH